MLFPRLVLGFYGVCFLIFGVWSLLAPANMAKILGYELTTAVSQAEMRTFYGGLEIGIAVFLLAPFVQPQLYAPALWALTAMGCGFVIGRLTGIFVDGASGGFIYGALVWEIAAAVLGFLAYRSIANSL